MELTCTNCARVLRVEGDSRGKRIRCPKCEEVMYVPMESGLDDQWWMRGEDGEEYGPVNHGQLEGWIAEGRVSAKCQVLQSGQKQWRWASEVFPQLTKSSEPVATTPFHGASTPVTSYTPATNSFNGASTFHTEYSDKTKTAAGLLAIIGLLTGIHGIQRFYLGHIGMGILFLLTFGFCGIGTIVDMVLAFTGGLNDAEGRPLRD